MGISNMVWDVDGIKNEYTGNRRVSQSRFFDRANPKKCWLWARPEAGKDNPGGGVAEDLGSPGARSLGKRYGDGPIRRESLCLRMKIRPDFSIRLIEILNSTFDPKWL